MTGPRRVLMVTLGADRQHRQLDIRQPGPPVALTVAKTTKQAMPAQCLEYQPDGLVFRATLEAASRRDNRSA